MAIRDRAMTSAEFLEYAALPENADRILELIDGEIVEKMVGYKSSRAAADILRRSTRSCQSGDSAA